MTVEQDQTLLIEDEIQTLKRRIASLEEFEMNVAQDYGMQSEEIVSPAILQKAKDMVLSLDRPSQEIKNKAVQTAVVLDSLYKLRCSLSELHRARVVRNLPASRQVPVINQV